MTQQATKSVGYMPVHAIFAYLSIDEDGNEGVLAGPVGNIACMPLVGADMTRMEALRPLAFQIAKRFGIQVRLCCFTNKSVLETIDGRSP